MKRIISLTAAIALIAVWGSAALAPELGDWGKGPAQYLMTKEEQAAWKKVGSDEQAKAFIALFWARRDPTPATPRNEHQEQFEQLVKLADERFPIGKKTRGALTERGRTLILFGTPTRIERSGTQRAAALPSGISEDPANEPVGEPNEAQVWTWEGESANAIFGIGKATIKFVDRFGNSEFRMDRSGTADVGAATSRAVARYLVQAGLTALPVYEAPPPPPPPAPVAVTELATESLRTAVAEFRAAAKSPYEKVVYASWGEFITAGGDTFVPLLVYVPKAAGVTPEQSLTFFGVIQDAAGANVLAFEEPAKLTASKDDFFVDHTVTLPAGKHRAFLGLAENGKALSIVAADLEVTGTLDKDATAVSPLILSNNIYPLAQAQKPTDPFAFGGLKVVPKADRRFRQSDELMYFIEMRNPGLPEPAPATSAAEPAVAGVVEASPASAAEPKVQIKIDVEGTIAGGQSVRKASPPTEVSPWALKGVPGHYGVGSPIPLGTFKPGDYTFTVKVIDTLKKTSYTMSEKFTVVE